MTLRARLTGNGEADAEVAAVAGDDLGIDADQLAAQVHQRAAGVTRIDRGVGLNEVLVAVGIEAGARQPADDSRSDGMLQAEGVADGYDEIADLEARGIAERHLREPLGTHLEHGDVRVLVAADHLGLEVAPVLQRHGDLVRVLDDVCVGDDVALLGVDNDARAGAAEQVLARAPATRSLEEAAKELVLGKRALLRAVAHRAASGDIDHRGRDFADHRRKRRERRVADRWRNAPRCGRDEREQTQSEGEKRGSHTRNSSRAALRTLQPRKKTRAGGAARAPPGGPCGGLLRRPGR